MKIAWTSSIIQHDELLSTAFDTTNFYKGFGLYVGDVVVENGTATLANVEMVYNDMVSFIEAQDFYPDDSGITFSSYWSLDRRFWPEIDPVAVVTSGGYVPIHNVDAEAWTFDLITGEVQNRTVDNAEYDEWEGIHPDGEISFLETIRDGKFNLYLSTLDTQHLRQISDLYNGGELMVDPMWNPNGTVAAVSYSVNSDPQRVIETHPAMALIEFDCD